MEITLIAEPGEIVSSSE